MKARWTRADVARALELEAAGLTQREIGARLGRSEKAVQHRLAYERGTTPRAAAPRGEIIVLWHGRWRAAPARHDSDAARL